MGGDTQASSWLPLLTRLFEQPNVERCQDAPLDVSRKEVLLSRARLCEQCSAPPAWILRLPGPLRGLPPSHRLSF